MMLGTRHSMLGLLAALCVAAATARAQDVEMASRASGRALPAGYYARIRKDPTAFTVRGGWLGRASAARRTNGVLGGTFRMAVVPALFANSGAPSVAASAIQQRLFDGPSSVGTLTQFYAEASHNNLVVTGKVLPWVRTQLTMQQVVGASFGLGEDARTGEYLVQALAAEDGAVDFGQFDNDGPDGIPNSGDDNGVVDAVSFLFLEGAASCGGPAIWPHLSGISGWTGQPFVTNDRRPNGGFITVDLYTVEQATSCDGSQVMGIATMAHEFGHVIGLPDMYDATDGILENQRRWVLGCWELMAGGAWGCGTGPGPARPTEFGPWTKGRLGWVTPQVVGTVRDQEFVLRPAHSSGDVLRVPLGTQEYLELEFRQKAGFDDGLPASGVLIHHVEPGRDFFPCPGCPRIYAVAVTEADGNGTLVRTIPEGGNRGEAGDAFGVSGPVSFSSVTTPALRTNAGAPTTVTFHSIVVDQAAGVARVRLTTDPTPALLPNESQKTAGALAATQLDVRAAGGALPYTWTVTGLPPGATATPGADRLTIGGTILANGSWPVALTIRDALGTTATATVTLRVTDPSIATARLAQPFLGATQSPLTDAERTFLDNSGNHNGRYDVGDLRAYLRRQAATH